jgi:hypothetical protein
LADETLSREPEAASSVSISASNDDAPIGPSADEEATYLATQRAATSPARPIRQNETGDLAETKNLPSLDSLVNRIPPEVRAALDDLFRAKFTAVRRVPEKALKS